MKRLRLAAVRAARVCAALVLYGVAIGAEAQTTALTATQQQWGNTWLTQGVISLIPVTPAGQPQAFSANGKFYPPARRDDFNSGFQGTVVKGALSGVFAVPDKAAASAAYPLCYDQQIRNDVTRQVVDLGVRCDITGSTVSLDVYVPSIVPPVLLQGYTHGVLAAMPAHCPAGSLYGADDTNALYKCGLDGLMHLLLGSGGGGGSVPALLLADVSTSGAYWALAISSGRLSLVSAQAGSGAVAAVTLIDSVSGAKLALSVAGGRMALSSASSSSGAVASLALVDTANGANRTLSASNGRLTLN